MATVRRKERKGDWEREREREREKRKEEKKKIFKIYFLFFNFLKINIILKFLFF